MINVMLSRSLAAVLRLFWRMAIFLVPPGHESAELGTRLHGSRPIWSSGPTAIPRCEGLLRRWLFLAGYRQPIAPAAFVTAMLLALAWGLPRRWPILGSGLTKELFANIAASRRPWVISCCRLRTCALDGALDPGAPAVDAGSPLAAATRGESGARFAHLSGTLATLSEAGLGFDAALSRVLDSVMEDRPLAREFRSYQSDSGRPNARGIAAAVVPPLGRLSP